MKSDFRNQLILAAHKNEARADYDKALEVYRRILVLPGGSNDHIFRRIALIEGLVDYGVQIYGLAVVREFRDGFTRDSMSLAVEASRISPRNDAAYLAAMKQLDVLRASRPAVDAFVDACFSSNSSDLPSRFLSVGSIVLEAGMIKSMNRHFGRRYAEKVCESLKKSGGKGEAVSLIYESWQIDRATAAMNWVKKVRDGELETF
ncbi:hypothetical protein [Pseudorhodoferax sp. Leaf267]|uniref:hypothetical protein n=1 Tax=Pseudorhodoferax sp. Leaf267 TaxID=1736316 RepID=UPI0012E21B9A|nr:hypothetical protein [Pseudorhodoferax sp. Leaf267]